MENLLIEFPARTLVSEDGGAACNLRLLCELGVVPGIRDFGGSIEEIQLLRSRGIEFVRMNGCHRPQDEMIPKALRSIVRVARECGATVLVDALDTDEQRNFWRALGAQAGVGPVFCPDVTKRWPGES